MRLLLLSNSTPFGRGYLDHAIDAIARFFGDARRLAFVPYALQDREAYLDKVRRRLGPSGFEVENVPADADTGRAALARAEGIFVGGGNTFRLLDTLQRTGLLEEIRARVTAGVPYMGASAGTNIASPTIRTTNDMPIVQPRDFNALGFLKFQINPHYLDADAGLHHSGETREQRLLEYLEENETPVLGIREDAWLRLEGQVLVLEGERGARLFRRGVDPWEIAPGAALDDLLG
jgi:dipeptidase E